MIAKNLSLLSAMSICGQVKTGCDPDAGSQPVGTGWLFDIRSLKGFGIKTRLIVHFLVRLVLLGTAGCSGITAPGGYEPEDCLRVAQARLDRTPPWDCLPTLDGQCVPLKPFFDTCSALWPDCVLYTKFYLWESEVTEIVSYPRRGPVSHRVRMYHNILHACRPDYDDAQRTHGDVAEFYNEVGRFMGLAVYMGQGLYCPLPIPGREAKPDDHRLEDGP
jgi:hypothetical protein